MAFLFSIILALLTILCMSSSPLPVSFNWSEPNTPRLPYANYGMIAGIYSDSIWLLGGLTLANKPNIIEYNIENNVFIEHGSLTPHSYKFTSEPNYYTTVNDTIYWWDCVGTVCGRFIVSYNMVTNTYNASAIRKRSVDKNIYCPCLTNIGTDYLIVLGGRNLNAPFDTMSFFRIYDLNNQEWLSNGPSMPIRRAYNFQCNVHNNQMYAIGGYYEESVDVIDVSNISNIDNVTWTTLNDGLEKRDHATTAIHGDSIYVLGGMTFTRVSTMEVINTLTNTITVHPATTDIRDYAPLVTSQNMLFRFGGSYDDDEWIDDRFDTFQYITLSADVTDYSTTTQTPECVPSPICACNSIYKPICCADGNTYTNRCHAEDCNCQFDCQDGECATTLYPISTTEETTTQTDSELCQEILKFSGGSVSGSSSFLNDLEWIKIIDENEDCGYYFMSSRDDYYMQFVSECKNKNWWLIFDEADSFNHGEMKPICDVAVGRCQRSQISECDGRWAFREYIGGGHDIDTNVKFLSMETKC